MQFKEPSLIYISGYGRSGSTILDIMLGNIDGHFSLGELSFFPTNGLVDNEYCSCGSRVLECDFWKDVAGNWQEQRSLSLVDYNNIYKRLFYNRSAYRLVVSLLFPNEVFKKFLSDTRLLYDIIINKAGTNMLIESSKNPYRLILFKKINLNVKVVHLIRDLNGVYDSKKKFIEKDPEKGVEKDLKERGTFYIIFSWMITNILVKLFSRGFERVTIKYEDLMDNPIEEFKKVSSLDEPFINKVQNGGPFKAPHVVAGGRVRMEKEIFIKKNIGKSVKVKPVGFTGGLVSLINRIINR